jgi:hypothetical protein
VLLGRLCGRLLGSSRLVVADSSGVVVLSPDAAVASGSALRSFVLTWYWRRAFGFGLLLELFEPSLDKYLVSWYS